MWNYLNTVYNQDNSARRFQLEYEMANFTQGSLSIEEYFSGFQTLWADYSDIVYANVPAAALSAVQAVHATSKRDQFLMKLRPDFEIARSNLMNRAPVPSLDACLSELLREEQRLLTQAFMAHQAPASVPISVAYAAQGRYKGRDMRAVQCFSCKAFGHIARDCPKKFCDYCKKQGHIISACPIRPERKQGTAFHTSTGASSSAALPVASPVVPIPVPIALANPNTLTPEIVQQMIISAFSAFGLSSNHQVSSTPWYFDSGASNHMTNTIVPLSNVRNYDGNLKINTADGSSLPISAVGDLSSSLTDVFVSPALSANLLSVGQLVDNNCNVNFSRSGCVVQDQVSGKMIAKGPKVGRLFPLDVSPSPSIPRFLLLSFACNAVNLENKMCHRRLGHPNSDVLRTLFNSGLLGNKACSSLDLSFDCTTCKLGKSKVLPFPSHASRASQCFDIIHSDVWGIAPVVSHAHYKYFFTFIDDFSRFTWVYFLRAKTEVFLVFQRFLALLETQFSASIKILQSDSGGEYMSNEFQTFLQSKGIISQRSCPSTPQQNGVAERKNRHLLDVVRTLLLESSVPPRFWCEALSTSVHLINRLPSPTLNHVSPFFKLFGHSPLYSDLRTFGCVCFVHLPTHERHKLTAQSIKCAFLGYAIPQKGYVCYDPHARRIRVSRNVVFFENQYFFPSHFEPPSASLSLLPNFLILRQFLNLVLCMDDVVDMSLVPLPQCPLPIMTRRLIPLLFLFLLLLPPLFVGLLVLLDPLIGMVSILLSLLSLLYPLFPFLLATNRPWNTSVGKM